MKKLTAIILICAAFVAGFFLGRATISTTETVKYVKGKTVHDSIPVPFPVKVEVPSDPKLIYKRDTIFTDTGRVIVEKVDTAAIIRDYIVKRQYAFDVYDDEFGSMKIDSLNVQYNQLSGFYYTRTPVQKVITRHSEKLFTPFVSGSYSTFDIIGLGGGIFIKDFGLEYQYQINSKMETGHFISGKWKF